VAQKIVIAKNGEINFMSHFVAIQPNESLFYQALHDDWTLALISFARKEGTPPIFLLKIF
jgi:hypothetical protein